MLAWIYKRRNERKKAELTAMIEESLERKRVADERKRQNAYPMMNLQNQSLPNPYNQMGSIFDSLLGGGRNGR